MTAEPIITKHARHRMRQRVGLPKRTMLRMARRARAEGVDHSTATDRLRRYLLELIENHRLRHHHKVTPDVRLFQGVVFIFEGDTLLTCWRLPSRLEVAI